MRDIIWTIVLVWLVYKLVEAFKSLSSKKSASSGRHQDQAHPTQSSSSSFQHKRDSKGAIQKHLNNDGEYVDFEEVK